MTRRRTAPPPILTKGSLCSGIGALDAATPGEARWVAETNGPAAAVLEREHPQAVNLGDITVPGLDPEHVDLVTSGDPCQSMSAAGRQMASADERFLWPDVIRIIERVRPGHVFLENVQALTSVPLFPGAARGTVLALRLDDLWRAGYEVRWAVVGACAVGAPHHRHRWFLRARWFGLGAPAPVRVAPKAVCGAPKAGGRLLFPTPMTTDGKGPGKSREKPWANLPSYVHHMLPTLNARGGGSRGTPSAEHAARRLADPMRSLNIEDAIALLPTPVAMDANGARNATAVRSPGKTGSGGWTLSDVGFDFAAARLLPTPRATDIGTPGRRSSEGWRPQLGQAIHELLPTPRATDGTNGGPSQRGSKGDLAMGAACQPEVWGRFASAVALWEQVTGLPAPEPTEPAPKGGRRLNPALAEWMMGYPPGYLTAAMPRNEALRCAGNGVVTLQARAAWDLLGEGWDA